MQHVSHRVDRCAQRFAANFRGSLWSGGNRAGFGHRDGHEQRCCAGGKGRCGFIQHGFDPPHHHGLSRRVHLTNLKPDNYSLTIEHPGFQKYTRQIQVLVGSRYDVSAQLTVTGASTTVEVAASSETAAVNTETQTLSQVVTAQQITDLPTLTRNPYDLVATSGNVAEDTQSGRGAAMPSTGSVRPTQISCWTAAKTSTCLRPLLARACRSTRCRSSGL